MTTQPSFPIRTECPPGACDCGREELLDKPDGDLRVLRLTQLEEKRLIERIERIDSYSDLLHVVDLLQRQLGISLHIAPGANEVRTARGFQIRMDERPGLCRKTRKAIPAAVRRCLENKPHIAWAILDANDLFGQS